MSLVVVVELIALQIHVRGVIWDKRRTCKSKKGNSKLQFQNY